VSGINAYQLKHVVVKSGIECPKLEERRECKAMGCTVDQNNGAWGDWAKCMPQCGEDRQSERFFTFNNASCPSYTESKTCPSTTCLSHCTTSEWGQWSQCTCGGERMRKRVKYAGDCIDLVQTTACGPEFCVKKEEIQEKKPIQCVQSKWGRWGKCSRKCISCEGESKGERFKKRKVLVEPQFGAPPCPPSTQSRPCTANKSCKGCGKELTPYEKYLETLA